MFHSPRVGANAMQSSQSIPRSQTLLNLTNLVGRIRPGQPSASRSAYRRPSVWASLKVLYNRGVMREIGSTLNADTVLWRYMETNRLVSMLDEASIYFAAAKQFGDKFEGAVFVQPPTVAPKPRDRLADHADNAFKQLTRLTKLNCWHISDFESNAMWGLYAKAGKGVAVSTTVGRLKESLLPFRLRNDYGPEETWCGPVQYLDLLQNRLDLGEVSRFFFKHRIFEWEKEFRVLISLRIAEEFGCEVPEDGINVASDQKKLVSSVVCGPFITDEERALVVTACDNAGISDRLRDSSTLGTPRYV
jgi:hypothetical protein